MKSQLQSKIGVKHLAFGFVALVGALLAGCSSTNHYQGDMAATSLHSAADEVQAESRALDLTMGALKDIMNESTPDLKQPYKHYSAALDHLVTAAERTESTGVKMAQRNAEFLQAWDKQIATIDYEHIRDLSKARKAEVTSRCEAVNKRYADSQAVVRPMIDYLQDIRRALNADLTVNGLAALKPVAENAEANAQKVQTALTALATELTDSGTKLSSVTATAQVTQQGGTGE